MLSSPPNSSPFYPVSSSTFNYYPSQPLPQPMYSPYVMGPSPAQPPLPPLIQHHYSVPSFSSHIASSPIYYDYPMDSYVTSPVSYSACSYSSPFTFTSSPSFYM